MWDMLVLIPDHCLSIYSGTAPLGNAEFQAPEPSGSKEEDI